MYRKANEKFHHANREHKKGRWDHRISNFESD